VRGRRSGGRRKEECESGRRSVRVGGGVWEGEEECGGGDEKCGRGRRSGGRGKGSGGRGRGTGGGSFLLAASLVVRVRL